MKKFGWCSLVLGAALLAPCSFVAQAEPYFSVHSTEPKNQDSQGAKGENAIAIGPGAGEYEPQSGEDRAPGAMLSSDDSVALGHEATVLGDGSIALGKGARTGQRYVKKKLGNGVSLVVSKHQNADRSIAIGQQAHAVYEDSLALGTGAQAGTATNAAGVPRLRLFGTGIALGPGARARAIAARGNWNYFIGDRALGEKDSNETFVPDQADAGLALGRYARVEASGVGSIAIGWRAHTNGGGNVLIGANARSETLNSHNQDSQTHAHSAVGIGTDVAVQGYGVIAMGMGAKAGDRRSGISASSTTALLTSGAAALGYFSEAQAFGGVALGAWSQANRTLADKLADLKKDDPKATYPIVAPFSNHKLYYYEDMLNVPNSYTQGDSSVVLGPVSVGGKYHAIGFEDDKKPFLRQIVNLADGIEDTDAVNIRQLRAVALAAASITPVENPVTYENNKREKIILKEGGTTIANVKDGSVAQDSQEAVNGGQLFGVQESVKTNTETLADHETRITANADALSKTNQQVEKNKQALEGLKDLPDNVSNLSVRVTGLEKDAVRYDTGSEKSKVTFGGTEGTTLANVKDGSVAKDSKEAVNGGQLFGVQQQVTANSEAIENLKNTGLDLTELKESVSELDRKANLPLTFQANSGKLDRTLGSAIKIYGTGKTGEFSSHNVTTAFTDEGLEIRFSESPSFQGILSAASFRTSDGAVQLDGQGLKIAKGPSVTRGGVDAAGTRISNLADGVAESDAVTVRQLEGRIAAAGLGLAEGRFREQQRRIDGTAARGAALSALQPLDYDEEKPTSFAVGLGHQSGQTAFALGVNHYFNRDLLASGGLALDGQQRTYRLGLALRFGSSPEYESRRVSTTDFGLLKKIEALEARDAEREALLSKVLDELAALKKQLKVQD